MVSVNYMIRGIQYFLAFSSRPGFHCAEQCISGKVNTNDSMGVDHASPTKPPKKGRKLKVISNGSILLFLRQPVFSCFVCC